MRRKVADLRREASRREGGGWEDDEPLHALPDLPVRRKGPFGASAGVHLLGLFLLVLASWRSEAPAPVQPEVNVIFQEPRREPPVALVHPKPPPVRRLEAAARPPGPVAPRPSERPPIAPPPVPREIPPPTPLPPPRRMGERVPIPHLPVPGTVPPEEGKSGRPGAPAPERQEKPPGTPDGESESDLGAGGSGATGAPREGPGAGAGAGIVPGGTKGRLQVPALGGGGQRESAGGGGRRRGLDLQLPFDSGAFGDFSFDDKDYDWSDYRSQMYWAIWRAWHNRLYAMTPIFDRWAFQNHTSSLKGAVLIRFVIERNGSVSSITVLDPSTMSPLDDSAVTALKEVILPRLPDDFTKDSEGVTGRFSMEIDDIAGFKWTIRVLKERGVF